MCAQKMPHWQAVQEAKVLNIVITSNSFPFADKRPNIKYQVECINRFLFTRRRCKYCLVLSIGQRSLTCPVISSSVTEHGGGLHASSDCMLQVLHRPGHLVRDICKHQLFVTLQHCLGSGEQLEVRGGYLLVHIMDQGNLFFSPP